MTECTQSSFDLQAHFAREVVARFDGGAMTSDAGAVLLRETDRRLNLLPRLAACFEDHRQPWLVSHTVPEMVAQRVYGLALGYAHPPSVGSIARLRPGRCPGSDARKLSSPANHYLSGSFPHWRSTPLRRTEICGSARFLVKRSLR
jgi:hypothetical protein